MSRFNSAVQISPKNPIPKVQGVSRAKPNTTNQAGGEAYSMPLRHEIASVVLNCMLNDRFYTSAQGNLEQLHDIVSRAEKAGETEFLAKAAIFARHTHGLRTVASILAGEIGDLARGAEWKRKFYAAYPQRPDDVCETLAYWNQRHPEARHPNAMTRGFAEALSAFDAYALAKYKGEGKGVNLMDAVNVCHPRVGKDHPIHLLMTGKLQAADTWEKALSAAGQTAETEEEKDALKGAAWARLLEDKKLGYLACLRNLRNIAEQAPEVLPAALDLIRNENACRKSRVFPFQFRTTYDVGREMGNHLGKQIQMAVAKAADISLANIPQLPGKTLVVVDDSGSMTTAGGQGVIKIASVFAAALVKGLPDCDYMQFSDDARFINLDTVGMGVFALAEKIECSCKSAGTNFPAIFERIARDHKSYDRIIILSDMQGWMQGGVQEIFAKYAKAVKAQLGHVPKLYSFDLTGSGTAQFPAEQVCLMAGFSDKIFDLMGQMEHDRDALVKAIDETQFVAKRRAPKVDPVPAPKVERVKAKAKRAPKGEKSAKARRAAKLKKSSKK